MQLRLISKGINSELDLLSPKHNTALPCRNICNGDSAPCLTFCHGDCVKRCLARLTTRGRLAIQEIQIKDLIACEYIGLFANVDEAMRACKDWDSGCDTPFLPWQNFRCRRWEDEVTGRWRTEF